MKVYKKWLNGIIVFLLVISMLSPISSVVAYAEETTTDSSQLEEVETGAIEDIIPTEEGTDKPEDEILPSEEQFENPEEEESTNVALEATDEPELVPAPPTIKFTNYNSGDNVNQETIGLIVDARNYKNEEIEAVITYKGNIIAQVDGVYPIKLAQGSNQIDVVATDTDGRATSTSIYLNLVKIAITIANHDASPVVYDKHFELALDDIVVGHYRNEVLIPTVTMSGIVITPNESGIYKIDLNEGSNNINIKATDSDNASGSLNYTVAYSRVKVIDFQPAVGQFTNSSYTEGVEKKVRSKGGTVISLGGFGGYVTVEFDESIANNPNNPYGIDFTIAGNPFLIAGNTDVYNNEPGGVMVAQNENGPWYHLAGSEYDNHDTITDYELTYYAPTGTESNVVWTDNMNQTGKISGKNYPSLTRFPNIDPVSYTMKGVAIFNDVLGTDIGTVRKQVQYGYVDSIPPQNTNYEKPNNPYSPGVQGSGGDAMDISWAVDEDGKTVQLDHIQYVKVYTAVNKLAGALGEISTEVKDFGRSDAIVSTVDKIQIKQKNNKMSIATDDRLQLYVDAVDVNNNGVVYPEIVWSSSNPEVATVNSVSGQVRSKTDGKTTITAALAIDPTISAQYEVIVEDVVAVSMDITTTGNTFFDTNSTNVFTAILKDKYGQPIIDAPVIWTTNNTDVIEITSPYQIDVQKSLIKAKAPGVATLTATSGSLSKTLVLRVENNKVVVSATNSYTVNDYSVKAGIDQAKVLTNDKVYLKVSNTSPTRTGDLLTINADSLDYAAANQIAVSVQGKEYGITVPSTIVGMNSTDKLQLTTLIENNLVNDYSIANSLSPVGKAISIDMQLLDSNNAIVSQPTESSEVSIKLSPDDLQDVELASLAAYQYDTANEAWVYIGGEFDSETYELTFAASNPGKFALFENAEKTVLVRVEGFGETIIPQTEVKLSAYDLSHFIDNDDIAKSYLTNSNPSALHAIAKVFEQNGYDLTDKQLFDFTSGQYISKLAGLAAFDKGGNSGWMYAVNDTLADRGVNAYNLSNQDSIVVYYVEDYERDGYSWFDQAVYSIGLKEQLTIELYSSIYGDNGVVSSPLSEVTILLDGSPYKVDQAIQKTNANGEVEFSFTEAGTYEITANIQYGSRPFAKIIVSNETVSYDVNLSVQGMTDSIITDTNYTINAGTSLLAFMKDVFSHEDINYELSEGENGTIFRSIANLENGSLAGEDRWTINVNGSVPSKSLQATKLKAGDHVYVTYTTVPELAIVDPIVENTVNPSLTIQLKGETFTQLAADVDHWKVNVGMTNLVLDEIILQSNQKVTLQFAGTSSLGTIEVEALPATVGSNKATGTLSSTIVEQEPEIDNAVKYREAAEKALLIGQQYLLNEKKTVTDRVNGSHSGYWMLSTMYALDVDIKKYPWLTSPVADDTYWKKLADKASSTSNEDAGTIIGAALLGLDPTTVKGRNYIEDLKEKQKADTGMFFTIYGESWAMMALDLMDAKYKQEEHINAILATQLEENGYFKPSTWTDLDATGWILMALAPHRDQPEVKAAIQKAVDGYNKEFKTKGFINNANTMAALISGLASVGEDLFSEKWTYEKDGKQINIINHLIENYQMEDGGVRWMSSDVKSNLMAVEQVYIALSDAVHGESTFVRLKQELKDNDGSGGNGPGGGNGENGGSNPGEGGGGTTPPVTNETVYLSIKAGKESFLDKTSVVVPQGASVYDALVAITTAKGISLQASTSSMGVYVEGINGLKEFDRGEESGWMYRVNGVFPNFSADKYILKSNDVVEWLYTESLGTDIGGGAPTDVPDKEDDTNNDNQTGNVTKEQIEKARKDGSHEIIAKQSSGIQVHIPLNAVLAETEKLDINVKLEGQSISVSINQVSANGVSTPLQTDNSYIAVHIPMKDLADDSVVFALVDGKYVAVPHYIHNGEVVILTKSNQQFVIVSSSVTFEDIANVSNRDEIEYLASRYVIKGTNEQTFSPNANISRAEFAVMIARALGLVQAGDSKFTDTIGKWYENDIQALHEAGIINGTSATSFSPNEWLSREDAAVLMARVLEYMNITVEQLTDVSYTDINSIQETNIKQIQLLYTLEIMSGNANSSFDPQGNLTRAQMAKILKRTLNAAGLM